MKWLLNLMIASFLFFPEKDFYAHPRDYGLTEQEVWIPTEKGAHLHGWFFERPSSKATLLFFHGNAGNISGRLFKAKGWWERGVSVLLVDYRGYGKSEGKIEKAEDLLADAHDALKWLQETKKVPPEKIILYGESIGSYPAIALAAQEKFAGLILEASFTRISELARLHYPWVPEVLLKDFEMPNEETIAAVRAPVFILHGDQDEICPVQFGERLYERAPSPKEFYRVSGGHHNDLSEMAGESFFEHPYRFMVRENRLE